MATTEAQRDAVELYPFGLKELEILCLQPDERENDERVRSADLDAWLAHRRTGLTGTDIAAIFGEHSRVKPIDVWYDKRPDLAPPAALAKLRAYQRTETERTRMGRRLEPVVKGWYSAGHPLWPRQGGPLTVANVPTMRRRDRPWQVISPDGAGYELEAVIGWHLFEAGHGMWIEAPSTRPQRGVEIKTHGLYGSLDLPDDDADEVALPPRLRLQPLWYQSGMELDEWDVAALVDTHRQLQWTVTRQPLLEADVLEESERWWQRHVIRGEEPQPDGSEKFTRHLAAKFGKHDDQVMPRRSDIDKLAAEIMDIRRRAKELAAREDAIGQQIRAAIGAHYGIETEVGRFTWVQHEKGQARYKDAFEEVCHRLGLTDAEMEAIKDKHRGDPPRAFNCPRAKRGK